MNPHDCHTSSYDYDESERLRKDNKKLADEVKMLRLKLEAMTEIAANLAVKAAKRS